MASADKIINSRPGPLPPQLGYPYPPQRHGQHPAHLLAQFGGGVEPLGDKRIDPLGPQALYERYAAWAEPPEGAPAALLPRATCVALALYAAVQIALPLRQFLYPGNACWTEQGYFFPWKVMLMEKNGDTEHWVVDTVTQRRYLAEPREILTPYQRKVMSTQPSMILAYARYLGPRWEQRLGHPVEVHVESFVSLNGARRQRLLDPAVDLSRQRDGLWPAASILPMSR